MVEKEKPEGYCIEPNQEWEVDLFRSEDAVGIARLFHIVYGDGYPVETFTDPDRLIQENAAGRIISIVARTAKGDIIAHTALYVSAPFHGLFEIGGFLVAPNYREEAAGMRVTEYCMKSVPRRFGIDIIFAEPVCNHIVSQKIATKIKLECCAIEVDLMPAEAYTKEASAPGRVATLLSFHIISPKQQTIYLPTAYEEIMHFIYDGIEHECRFISSSEKLLEGKKSLIDTQIFDFAKVARFAVHEAGADFASVFDQQEEAALQKGTLVHHVWLKLSWPWVGCAVDFLRTRGYFFGGVLPRWFDVDGLLMQKVFETPGWNDIQVFGERASRILEMVKTDWCDAQNRPENMSV